jgi:trehalose-6-phosphate synthase
MFNYAIPTPGNVPKKFEKIVCIEFSPEHAPNKQSYVSAVSEIKKLFGEIKHQFGDYDWEEIEVCF